MPSDICAEPSLSTGVRNPPALGGGYTLAAAPAPRLTSTQQQARDAILRSDQPGDYEIVTCPCGSPSGDRLLAEVDRHGIPCRNVICLGCGLIRLTPRWRQERYDRFYRSEYRSLYNPSLASKAEYAREIAGSPATAQRVRWIEQVSIRHRLPATPRVVELGSGAGWNLVRLPSNWAKLGYDVDDEYLEIGRASFGLELRRGLVEDALEVVSQADIVLLSHVVEHLPKPEEVLELIAGRLPAGGLLLMEVPGVFRLHRSNLTPRDYLQNAHTFTYCAATLQDSCRRAGLDPLEIDQEVRAVCRVRSPALRQSPALRPGLAGRIIRYLRLCDSGYGQYLRLRRLPGVGRGAAAIWKRSYFALVGLTAPAESS